MGILENTGKLMLDNTISSTNSKIKSDEVSFSNLFAVEGMLQPPHLLPRQSHPNFAPQAFAAEGTAYRCATKPHPSANGAGSGRVKNMQYKPCIAEGRLWE